MTYKKLPLGMALLLFLICHSATRGAVLYVDVNSTNPTPPYANWTTASTDIQSALDAASAGDMIWVNDGIYQTGGRVVYGALTNRVVINKAVTVQSVNGPGATIIEGYQDTNTVVAADAIRCVYLTNNAVLSGFTLTNGATCAAGDANLEQSGGGAWCEATNAILTNCVIAANEANNLGGGIVAGTLLNCALLTNLALNSGGGASGSVLNGCVLNGNTANLDYLYYNAGGGAVDSLLTNCFLTNNFSGTGGGAETSTLLDCTLSANGAVGYGGGADSSILIQCLLTSNQVGVGAAPMAAVKPAPRPHPLLIEPDAGGGASSSTLTNCVLVGNQAVGYSVGGGADSSILDNCQLLSNSADESGGGANNSTLNNCVVTNNYASYDGGGASGGILNNCWLTANSTGAQGGGADGSTLNSCLVVGNSSAGQGGGSCAGLLNNCTIISNSAPTGAGIYAGTANNCIIYDNNGIDYDGAIAGLQLNYCCTMPDPGGIGNITNAPLFVNPAVGDFHLQSSSPCINSGDNSFVILTTDLDGNPRIVGGTVDIGAYEFQTPSSVLSYAWAQQYDLPTDGAADNLDLDGTGMKNWQKSIAGLNPTNPASVLAMLPPPATNNAAGVTINWDSVSTRLYYLQRATDLTVQPAFSAIQSNIVGQAWTTSFTDTSATNAGPYFYSIGVQ